MIGHQVLGIGDSDSKGTQSMPQISMAVYKTKRIYDKKEPEDGLRVLVDRLWPRGMSKPRAALDNWLKEIASSNKLRIAYHAGELDFEAFAVRYRAELEGNPAIEELRALAAKNE